MSRPALTHRQRADGRRLAQALRAAREQRKAPQSALAELSGISIDTIRKLERNGILSPSFFTVARLARGLGVTLDTLAAEALDDAEGDGRAPEFEGRRR